MLCAVGIPMIEKFAIVPDNHPAPMTPVATAARAPGGGAETKDIIARDKEAKGY